MSQRTTFLFTTRRAITVMMLCLSIPIVATAQTITLEVGIGATKGLNDPYLANYIVKAYEFIVGSIGIVAAVMIMFNGFRWVTAGGNSEAITVAKGGVTNAIIGLLIALMSYVLLNTINPALVGYAELEQSTIEFREPVTTSTAAMLSGEISDDPTLISYMTSEEGLPSDLKPYLENQASEPHITQTTFDALSSALKLLRDNAEYQGMKLVIASANRSLDTQERLWACYQSKETTGSCPGGACGTCNQAAKPGKSRHGYGNALDISWKNTGGGKYVTTTGYASSSWHDSCMVSQSGSNCTTNLRNSVIALNTMMQSAGFSRICIEWWHHQIGGSSDSLCSPGQYK